MSQLFRRKAPTTKAHPRLFSAVLSLFVLCAAIHGLPTAQRAEESPVFSKCWDYSSVPDLRVDPVSDESNVYFLDNENKLIGVNLSAGSKVWSAEVAGDVASNLLIVEDSVLVVTSVKAAPRSAPTAVLWSLSRQTGITEWRA